MNEAQEKRLLLIIDDEKDVLVFLSLILQKRGFKVITPHSTDAIVELLRIHPDLILLDINMPGMKGTEICSLVKSRPETHNTPVILMPGNHDLEQLAKKCGADGWIAKPFETSEIVGMVEDFLASV